MINIIESTCFSFSKGAEKTNQDAMLPPKSIAGGILFAVADGVGSYKGSELASLSAIEYLNNIESIDELLDYSKVFNEILEKIKILSKYDIEYEKASTTLTYCFFDTNGLHMGHIGDCRAYVMQGRKLKQLTKDHTQHQKYLDEKIFTKKQLKNVKGKNLITTAISQVVPMEYSNYFISTEELKGDSNVLNLYIMSDGAHSPWEQSPRFSKKTMESVVRMGASLQRRIERKEPVDDYTYVACSINLDDNSWSSCIKSK